MPRSTTASPSSTRPTSTGSGESEELLGRRAGVEARRDVVIATKFGMDMEGANGPDWGVRGSRRYIRKAVEASLRRLGTDWIDLYQLHKPDPHTPIEETLAALHELVVEGKVRYIGSSNLSGWQIIDADWTARTNGGAAFVTAQNQYSLYDRSADDEVIPACEHVGVDLLPYFPLASGLLTGKYGRGRSAPRKAAGWPAGPGRPPRSRGLRPGRGHRSVCRGARPVDARCRGRRARRPCPSSAR